MAASYITTAGLAQAADFESIPQGPGWQLETEAGQDEPRCSKHILTVG